MDPSNKTVNIYVRLLNEGTEVFRPTQASELGDGLYKLHASSDYDTEDEEWELLPGELVRVELYHGQTGDIALAVKP